jgi:hypothetical protein
MDNIELTRPSLRYRSPMLLMLNVNGRFEGASKTSGEPFRIPIAARDMAFGDLDNYGFVDVAINCLDGNAMVLRKLGNENHRLMIDLVGTVSNRDGIGASVRIVTESSRDQYAIVGAAGSYMSASDMRAHLGLGRDTRVKLVEITWPSGIVQKLENVPADRIHRVQELRK